MPEHLKRLAKHAEAMGKWLGGSLLDLLYPPVCGACGLPLGRTGELCESCFSGMRKVVEPFCETCGEGYEGQIDTVFRCPNCSDLKFSFEFARPAYFRNDSLMKMIHRLKYGREIHLAQCLGKLAVKSFTDPRLAVALAEKWPLVPVPLHWRRQQWRHFNQAQEIARAMATELELPLLPALRRIRPTKTQTLFSRKQRLANFKGAFRLSRNGTLHRGRLAAGAILVDDVFTTGSTVEACAKVLKKAGVRRVVVVTVMRS